MTPTYSTVNYDIMSPIIKHEIFRTIHCNHNYGNYIAPISRLDQCR